MGYISDEQEGKIKKVCDDHATQPQTRLIPTASQQLASGSAGAQAMNDPVHPQHYKRFEKHEPIDVIGEWRLNFNLGNVVKYISRCGSKSDEQCLTDLEKAQCYLNQEVTRRRESFLKNRGRSSGNLSSEGLASFLKD